MADIATLSGTLLIADPTAPLEPATKQYVDTGLSGRVSSAERGPIGGIGTATLAAGTTTLSGASLQLRWTLNGDVTVNAPLTATDGQRILVEALANGANRTVTFSTDYELGAAVPSRSITIPSGTWAYIALVYRTGTTRIVSVDPVTPAAAIAITYAASITPNATLGSQFYCSATGNITGISPTAGIDGQRLMVEVHASGATRTATTALTNASGATLPLSIASGKVGYLGFVYTTRGTAGARWVLVAAAVEA